MISFLIFLLSIISFFTNRKSLSLFLLMALVSGGFWILGAVVPLFGISIRSTDYALLYVFIILFYKIITNTLTKLPRELEFINYFLIFLFVAIFIDLTLNGTSINDIFRMSRGWLFLLFVYLLPSFSKEEIITSFKWVIYFTLLELFLFLTEPFTGKILFSYDGTLKALERTANGRYALIPPYLIFIFTWFYVNKNMKKVYRTIILSLIFIAFVITLTRSLLLAVVIIVISSIVLAKDINIYKRMSILFLLVFFSFSVSFYGPLSERLHEGASEINNSHKQGNITFRLLLAGERLDYILKTSQTALFGIGYISETHFKGNFKIGLPNKEGGIVQLDTGDIAWPAFFLRLGLLGTILYIMIYLKLFLYFFKNRENSYALIGLYYLLFCWTISTAGTMVAQGVFILIPALLYKLTRESKFDGLNVSMRNIS